MSAATGIVLADRADPRFRARVGDNCRQFLGRYDPLHALHPNAAVDRRSARSWSGKACRRTLGAYVDATTLEGAKQTIAAGPAASQIAIKQLGTNGGGFCNANASRPISRTRPRCQQLPRDALDLADPCFAHQLFGRMVMASSARAGRSMR